MGNEMTRIGRTNNRATAQTQLVTRLLGQRAGGIVLRITSKAAAKLNKHSAKMEQQLSKLEKATNLLIESNVGYLSWFTPQSEQDEQRLINERASVVLILNTTLSSLAAVQSFRESQLALMGVSQELNTAINRMVHTTDGVIEFMHKSGNHWQELIEIIDGKLSY